MHADESVNRRQVIFNGNSSAVVVVVVVGVVVIEHTILGPLAAKCVIELQLLRGNLNFMHTV